MHRIKCIKKKYQGEFLFQDSITKATVYKLNDGRVIAYPAVGEKGIIAESEHEIIMIFKGGFPVIEENPNPFQKEQEKIISIAKNSQHFLSELSNKLKILIDTSDTSITYYKQISKAVNEFGLQKFYDEIFISFGFFVGEKIRKEKNAEWVLEKHYAYNPYYEPILVDKNNEVYRPWHKLAQMIIKKKKFDFEYYYSIVSIGGY